ncbi:MAG: sigma-70 family RNA polymerase sigma factor [Gemmataceae bacterium]
MSSSALAAGLRHLRGKLAAQQHNDDSDEQLLHAFTTRRDDNAFAVLVRRHGPMVLHVCRRVLGHEQDAEDAFQAAFLVLARNANALRNKTSLANFLHGIAYRTAMKAKQAAARRRKHEGQAPPRSPLDPVDDLSWREVRTLLDEEIDRLPEKYRSVFVLCCLENLSRAEAGQRLGLKERTVLSRLAEARKRLQSRLTRRGVELTAVLGTMALTESSASALPVGLMASTIQGVLAAAAGKKLASVVSASVAELVENATTTLIVSKAKMATLLLVTATLLAGAGAWTCRTLATPQPAEPQAKTPASPSHPAQVRQTESPRQEKSDSVTVTGRVLDPDGKPAAGASVYVDPVAENERPIFSTTTAKDGRFSLVLPRSKLIVPETKAPLSAITIVATAKECGPDWREVPLPLTPTLSPRGRRQGEGITLRLVKDDVPIQGRILSLEGKPLAGVEVSVQTIEAFPRGDLSRVLQAVREGALWHDFVTEVRRLGTSTADASRTVKTDADGRFRLDAIGRDRIATLHLKGPRIHYSSIAVMTRPGESVSVRNPKRLDPKGYAIHGATFEYLARPSRLIRGTVREKDTGKPLAGIHILSYDSTVQVRTDAQGRYELPGLPKGDRYGVLALSDNGEPYFSTSVEVEDTAGLGPLAANLEMNRGILFEGKVLDGETGKPVPGHVSYFPLRPNPYISDNYGLAGGVAAYSEARVSADGSFHCSVLPGPGCIVFQAKDDKRFMSACVDPGTIDEGMGNKDSLFVPFRGGSAVMALPQERYQAILLIDPKKNEKKLVNTLRPAVARPVIGDIQDPDGKPLTDVSVLSLEASYVWKTLANDKFTVHGVNPLRPRRLTFVHEAKHWIATVEVKGTETKPLIVQLQPWAAVHGRLLDADGRPLRNAKLNGSEFLAQDGRTDGEGRFRLEGLIPGLRYDLTYEKDKPSVSGMLLKGFVGKAGEDRDLGDVRGQPFRPE